MKSSLTTSDVFTWDTRNWSRVLPLWEAAGELDKPGLKCLELGAEQGGLSLWLATQGHDVICSDLEHPESKAARIHQEMDISGSISYEAVDATAIPFEAAFDVIIFKSILGGIGREGHFERMEVAVREIHKALKPGGRLLFVENLSASALHRFARKRFVSWGKEWHYLSLKEVHQLLQPFDRVELKTFGFFGAFGRSERSRNSLGRFDTAVDRILPKGMRYIAGGVAVK